MSQIFKKRVGANLVVKASVVSIPTTKEKINPSAQNEILLVIDYFQVGRLRCFIYKYLRVGSLTLLKLELVNFYV